jgi:hypothetical protein
MAFTQRGNPNLKLIIPDGRNELLRRGAPYNGRIRLRFPLRAFEAHVATQVNASTHCTEPQPTMGAPTLPLVERLRAYDDRVDYAIGRRCKLNT